MGKEPEQEEIHVYVWLNPFALHLKLTQHCKSTIHPYKIKSFLKCPLLLHKKKKKPNNKDLLICCPALVSWQLALFTRSWREIIEKRAWGFPGSPVVKTLCFHHGGHGLDPWLGEIGSNAIWEAIDPRFPKSAAKKGNQTKVQMKGSWRQGRTSDSRFLNSLWL